LRRNYIQLVIPNAVTFFCTKIATKWQEPYRIVQKLGPLNYEIVLGTLNKT